MSTPDQRGEAAPEMAAVWRYAAASVIAVVPLGVLMPLISVELAARGHSSTAVGATGFLMFLGVFLLSPRAPAIRARIGITRVHRAGMALWSLAVAGLALGDGLLWWYAMFLATGIAAALIWGVAESLIAEYAPAERLGRVTGLYQTMIGAAVTIGPFLPRTLGLDFRAAGVLAVALVVLSWVPLLRMRPLPLPVSGTATPMPWRRAVAVSPALAVGALLGGIFESGVNALGPVQGLHLGLAAAVAAVVPGVIAAGSLAMQYPAGWIADRVAVLALLVAAAAILAASGVLLALAPGMPWLLWPAAAIWGGVGGTLYTLVMIRVGVVFRGADVPTATALAITAYTFGALIGPAIAGPAMDASPRHGLAAVLAVMALAALAAMLAERAAERRRDGRA